VVRDNRWEGGVRDTLGQVDQESPISQQLFWPRTRGPLKYRDVPGSIGVLESPDNAMPIGQADCLTWDENDLAVWKLNIGGHRIEGRWMIIDREFKRV
jgi:hypothetical protein